VKAKTASLVVAGLVSLTITGCTVAKKHHFSGFLDDYSKLEPSPVEEGALFYQNPDIDFTEYDQIYVHPVSVHFADSREEQAVSPKRLAEYKQVVRDGLRDALAEYNLDSARPGERVAELRFQVANLRRTRMIESPRSMYGARCYLLGSANAEAELVDGNTGVVLSMHVENTVPPKWIETWSEQGAWETLQSHTRRAIDRWVSIWAPRFVAESRQASDANGKEGGS
jgi:hypothetical protein